MLSFFLLFNDCIAVQLKVISISSRFVSILFLSNVKLHLGILWKADVLLALWQKAEGWGSGMKFWELALSPPEKERNIWRMQKAVRFILTIGRNDFRFLINLKAESGRQTNIHVRIMGNLLTPSLSGKHKCNHCVLSCNTLPLFLIALAFKSRGDSQSKDE